MDDIPAGEKAGEEKSGSKGENEGQKREQEIDLFADDSDTEIQELQNAVKAMKEGKRGLEEAAGTVTSHFSVTQRVCHTFTKSSNRNRIIYLYVYVKAQNFKNQWHRKI